VSQWRDHLHTHGDQFFATYDDVSDPISASDCMRPLKEDAAAMIVWLEIKGRSSDAGIIDGAITALDQVARAYDHGEIITRPPVNEFAEPETPVEQLRETVSQTAGRLEDLLNELPEDVWEGYGDA